MGKRVTPPLPQRVVGIGASAGGLDALKQLIARAPTDTGLAFVVLQHLPPSQTGQLAELLAPCTSMPVTDGKTGDRLLPNTILVVPPRAAAVMFRGALVIRESKSGDRPHLPIDGLFESLAAVLGDRAIGVVLSGTGSDGTEGLRAIHAAAGLTFAQDPSTAQFDDMPRSAIAAGVAEIVLEPAQIGDEIQALARYLPLTPADSPDVRTTSAIDRILTRVREAIGVDFSSYKRTTIERRITRRLVAQRLDSLDEYAAQIEAHPEEARALYEDLLIHVTEFFRDGAVLDTLTAQVLAMLVKEHATDAPVRVWIPGCSTGEEVYSLAILLLELLDNRPDRIQLFGTDLSERAIESARAGLYSTSIESQVSPARLARYFHLDDGGYRINKSVRERCVFVHHNLLSDPPFSKIDLVSCRNLLIYLGTELQRQVIPTLHYALNQPGYLLLGRAETIAGFESLFSTIDHEARVYARKPAKTALHLSQTLATGRSPVKRSIEVVRRTIDVQRDVDHILLTRYAPACVVVDDNFDVVQFRGRTSPYLEQPPGEPQQNLLRLARDELAADLPLALKRAQKDDAPVRRENISVRTEHGERRIHLEVAPLRANPAGRRHFLVIFEEAPPAREVPRAGPRSRSKAKTPRESVELTRMRQELVGTKEYLHAIMSQHLSTTEELGITNEELQSANEELQSSNEELQTAKEELQSTNEELETVNEELQLGNERLRNVNDDLINVLASTDFAIIIVDTERLVRRFTPKARLLMKLLTSDLGRPIDDLQPQINVTDIDTRIAQVIESLEIHESEVRHVDGTWYRMQIRPYRTSEHEVRGAVIALVDISVLRQARELAISIVECVPTPLVVLDEKLRVSSANRAFFSELHHEPEQAIGQPLLELGEWKHPGLRESLTSVARAGTRMAETEVAYAGHHGDRVLRVIATPMPSLDGYHHLLVGITDVTERARFERARESAKAEREAFLDAVSHELRTPLAAIMLWAQALRELPPDDPQRVHAVDTILESARAEAALVDDLIDLSISRASSLSVTLEVIDSRPIIEAAVQAARAEASSRRVTLSSELDASTAVVVDPRRLRQITASLISNAVKFTPEGGTVGVSTASEADMVVLRVTDTGPGIPREFLPRVFDAFAQVDQSTTRAHRGLGIGLALVRHLVERQHGTVVVESSDAMRGTTFAVRLRAQP